MHGHQRVSADGGEESNGFLGRYGLGNRILQEGGSFEEAAEHLRVAVQLDPCMSPRIWLWAAH
jgi:hypothetical protein